MAIYHSKKENLVGIVGGMASLSILVIPPACGVAKAVLDSTGNNSQILDSILTYDSVALYALIGGTFGYAVGRIKGDLAFEKAGFRRSLASKLGVFNRKEEIKLARYRLPKIVESGVAYGTIGGLVAMSELSLSYLLLDHILR